jgi:hypothetical protein
MKSTAAFANGTVHVNDLHGREAEIISASCCWRLLGHITDCGRSERASIDASSIRPATSTLLQPMGLEL